MIIEEQTNEKIKEAMEELGMTEEQAKMYLELLEAH